MRGKSVTGVPLLIDTGADATLIPRAILPFLDISEDALEPSGYLLVGFDGTQSAVLVPVELEFLGKRLAGEYLLTEANYGVLGRDVLNLFRLVFDGPHQVWNEAPYRHACRFFPTLLFLPYAQFSMILMISMKMRWLKHG